METVKRKILVIEDNAFSRKMLHDILVDDYILFEAGNGKAGLEGLEQENNLALIILDWGMPVMGGEEFLKKVQQKEEWKNIPIIVSTANSAVETKYMDLGVTEFIIKPLNPDLVRNRVSSTIRYKELNSIVKNIETDKLTGLHSHEIFYDEISRFMKANEEKEYDIICCEVKNFSEFNDRYGKEAGDRVLKIMAAEIVKRQQVFIFSTIVNEDTFMVMVEHDKFRSRYELEMYCSKILVENFITDIGVKFGVYQKVDKSLLAEEACERALLALKSIHGREKQKFAYYDTNYLDEVKRNEHIRLDIDRALDQEEIVVHYQPKYNLETGEIVGGEALARWKHPEYGFMYPGSFVGVLEDAGLISKLDFFVFESVTCTMRKWINQGRKVKPISVNFSRFDFECSVFVNEICRIADKYEIPHNLLHIEVKESAYTKNLHNILEESKELKNRGFLVELDNFGAGYLTLNILDDISIDVLKIDVHSYRKRKPLEQSKVLLFIVNLAKFLDVTTVAEGVESKEEMEYLKEQGCDYGQGKYFYMPMCVKQFEKLLWPKE